jgi:hypothetical protein
VAGVINSISGLLRAVVSLAIVGMLSIAGWLGYQLYDEHTNSSALIKEQAATIAEREATIGRQRKEIETKTRRIQQLEIANRLLKVDHRVAEMTVLAQWESKPTGQLKTKFQFVEVDNNGRPLDQPKEYTVDGDIVYIDAWVVKYDDQFVEAGDPLRSTSICLFRRVFGEHQRPIEGYPIDAVGSRPAAYSRGSEMTDFEREIWENFWEYANNPSRAKQAGVSSAGGEAPSIKLQKGSLYKVELRASGGLSIKAEERTDERAKPVL